MMEVAVGIVGAALALLGIILTYIWRANGRYMRELREWQERVAHELLEGQRRLMEGQERLMEGQERIAEGIRSLQEGQERIVEGIRSLQEGQKEIARGIGEVARIAQEALRELRAR